MLLFCPYVAKLRGYGQVGAIDGAKLALFKAHKIG